MTDTRFNGKDPLSRKSSQARSRSCSCAAYLDADCNETADNRISFRVWRPVREPDL